MNYNALIRIHCLLTDKNKYKHKDSKFKFKSLSDWFIFIIIFIIMCLYLFGQYVSVSCSQSTLKTFIHFNFCPVCAGKPPPNPTPPFLHPTAHTLKLWLLPENQLRNRSQFSVYWLESYSVWPSYEDVSKTLFRIYFWLCVCVPELHLLREMRGV